MLPCVRGTCPRYIKAFRCFPLSSLLSPSCGPLRCRNRRTAACHSRLALPQPHSRRTSRARRTTSSTALRRAATLQARAATRALPGCSPAGVSRGAASGCERLTPCRTSAWSRRARHSCSSTPPTAPRPSSSLCSTAAPPGTALWLQAHLGTRRARRRPSRRSSSPSSRSRSWRCARCRCDARLFMYGCSLDYGLVCLDCLRLQVRRARDVQLFSDIIELPAPLLPAEYSPLP